MWLRPAPKVFAFLPSFSLYSLLLQTLLPFSSKSQYLCVLPQTQDFNNLVQASCVIQNSENNYPLPHHTTPYHRCLSTLWFWFWFWFVLGQANSHTHTLIEWFIPSPQVYKFKHHLYSSPKASYNDANSSILTPVWFWVVLVCDTLTYIFSSVQLSSVSYSFTSILQVQTTPLLKPRGELQCCKLKHHTYSSLTHLVSYSFTSILQVQTTPLLKPRGELQCCKLKHHTYSSLTTIIPPLGTHSLKRVSECRDARTRTRGVHLMVII